ncbi:MAG: hypothetical protein NUV54_01975 [Candidatus Taylorbacteria bacterium]|nr:hypothetical protein [Candidatus Taylorbacteria bacterium]
MLTKNFRTGDWSDALAAEVKSIGLLKGRCGNEFDSAIIEAAERAVETEDPFKARQLKVELASEIFSRLDLTLSGLLKFMENRECCEGRARELQRQLVNLRSGATEQPYFAVENLLLLKRGIEKLYAWQRDQSLSQEEILQRFSSASHVMRARLRIQGSTPMR